MSRFKQWKFDQDSSNYIEILQNISKNMNQRYIVPVVHDEYTYNANDGVHFQWIEADNNLL